MKKILGVVAMLVLTATAAVAQVNFGSIRGTVTDSTGAVIKGAKVVAVDEANGSTKSELTNGSGEFALTNLNADTYKVTVTATGFTATSTSFTLSVGSVSLANFKLSTGKTETVVEVAADSFGGVNLESQEISQVITPEQVTELPSQSRNPYDFAGLSGFASADSSAASRGVGLNFSGARSASTDVLLDGAENTNVYGVSVGQNVPLDSVQEFRVISADFPAQFGRASGGVVNVITKQGSNSFHGSAWEFNRISDLASNSYNNNALGQPKSRFVRNQFGYSVGGPVFKNKLFFFSSTEWTRIRSNSLVAATVALPGLINQAAAATQAYFTAYGTLADPVNGPTYSLANLKTFGPFAAELNSTTFATNNPTVNYSVPAFGVVYYETPADSGAGTPQNTYDTLNNLQWVISDRTTLTGRYSLYSVAALPGSNNTSPYAGYNTGSKDFDNNFLGTLTHTFTNTISNATKVLYSRLNDSQPLGSAPVGPTLYSNSSSVPAVGNGTLFFPGYSPTAPGNAIPFGGPQNFGQVINDTNWIKGKHSILFGGEFLYIKDNRVFGAYDNAVESLGTNGSSNAKAINNFLHGTVGQFEAAINPQGEQPCVRNPATGAYIQTTACTLTNPLGEPNFSRSNRYKDYAVYAQDSWRATPRLNVNLGLRWEVYGPQHSQKPSNDANFFPGNGTSLIDQIAHGNVYTRANSPIGGLWQNNFTQFGPRVGFAYDLTGDGKTSLRAGYGISFERNFNNVTFNVIQNPPNYAVVNYTTSSTGNQTLATANLGPLAGSTGSIAFPNPTLRAVNPHIRPAYTQSYTIGVQREVKPGTTVEVNYTGERGIRNYSISALNRSYYGGIYEGYADPALRANLQYSSINFRGADGDSYYSGLDVGVNSKNIYHSGLTLTAHYTWAHSTDNTSSTFTDGTSNNTNLGYLDPLNKILDHGSSDFDIRDRLVVAPVYVVPYFKSYTGWKKLAFDGFEFSSIFSATTGNPFTEFDESACLTDCARATFVQPQAHKRTGNETDLSGTYGPNTFGYIQFPQYYDAFGNVITTNYVQKLNPITGSNDYGPFPTNMSARNAFAGPGQWDLDASIDKTLAISARYGLQIRAEFYNLPNHANTYLNNDGINDVSSFNYALSYKQGRRTTQLAARFTF